jgi:hypothetical protein
MLGDRSPYAFAVAAYNLTRLPKLMDNRRCGPPCLMRREGEDIGVWLVIRLVEARAARGDFVGGAASVDVINQSISKFSLCGVFE